MSIELVLFKALGYPDKVNENKYQSKLKLLFNLYIDRIQHGHQYHLKLNKAYSRMHLLMPGIT